MEPTVEPGRAPEPGEEQATAPRALRPLFHVLGLAFTALALAGALLPVLPTTPFLLVAAWCFTRSSPAFLRRLLAMPVFGPYLQQWRSQRSIPPAAKRRAYLLVVLSFGFSVWAVEGALLRAGLVVGGLVLLAFLGRLPTAEPS